MRIETEVFITPVCFGSPKPWQLWFVSDSYYPYHKCDCNRFSAKPTKKQIRKLRRQFRKSA